MKTILIVLTQSFLIRNILRSGGFELLKKKGHRLVIFIQCKELPLYIKDEFRGENVTLISVFPTDPKVSLRQRIIKTFLTYFFWNKSVRRNYTYDILRKNPNAPIFLHLAFLRLVSGTVGKMKSVRLFIRWLYALIEPERDIQVETYFKTYQPDLVFSPNITSKSDTVFIQEAKRRHIPTISMPKTWDTVTRTYYHVVPDYFFVQNEILKEKLIELQDIPEDRIFVIGFLEYDWYVRKDIMRSRREHLERYGLDPKLATIFFGSAGNWYPKDYTVAEQIYEWIQKNELVKPCQMIVRPHNLQSDDMDTDKNPFLFFKGKPSVFYDDTYHYAPEFQDKWDPTISTIIEFVNTLKHSDVFVMALSTLALDGACFNKPIINVLFGSFYANGKDMTHKMISTVHYDWVLDTKATSIAWTPEELKRHINRYLEHPEYKSKERHILRDKLCYKVDGKSSERMVNAIEKILIKN